MPKVKIEPGQVWFDKREPDFQYLIIRIENGHAYRLMEGLEGLFSYLDENGYAPLTDEWSLKEKKAKIEVGQVWQYNWPFFGEKEKEEYLVTEIRSDGHVLGVKQSNKNSTFFTVVDEAGFARLDASFWTLKSSIQETVQPELVQPDNGFSAAIIAAIEKKLRKEKP